LLDFVREIIELKKRKKGMSEGRRGLEWSESH